FSFGMPFKVIFLYVQFISYAVKHCMKNNSSTNFALLNRLMYSAFSFTNDNTHSMTDRCHENHCHAAPCIERQIDHPHREFAASLPSRAGQIFSMVERYNSHFPILTNARNGPKSSETTLRSCSVISRLHAVPAKSVRNRAASNTVNVKVRLSIGRSNSH